jgi:tetratricopeptide (TPR) repeat protein
MLPPVVAMAVLAFPLAGIAFSQDTVIHSSATDPAARIKKQGQILDYTGTELKLRTSLGRDETIFAGRILEFKTTWTPQHLAGDAARAAGNLDEAIAAYEEARRVETRPWAVRQIMAELAGTYLEAGRIDQAGDEFMAIVASDPVTQHYETIPIAWRAAAPDAGLEARAAKWLAARAPLAQLLGASWLLAGSQRSEAIAALETVSTSADPRLAALATCQLWRAKLVSAKPTDVALWQGQLEKMPREVQAAGWYVLGELWSRQNEPERAALAYLKVPLLFRRQRAMAADALLAAGKQLEKMGQASEAAGLYREIARDFGHLPAAAEADTRLKGLTK